MRNFILALFLMLATLASSGQDSLLYSITYTDNTLISTSNLPGIQPADTVIPCLWRGSRQLIGAYPGSAASYQQTPDTLTFTVYDSLTYRGLTLAVDKFSVDSIYLPKGFVWSTNSALHSMTGTGPGTSSSLILSVDGSAYGADTIISPGQYKLRIIVSVTLLINVSPYTLTLNNIDADSFGILNYRIRIVGNDCGCPDMKDSVPAYYHNLEYDTCSGHTHCLSVNNSVYTCSNTIITLGLSFIPNVALSSFYPLNNNHGFGRYHSWWSYVGGTLTDTIEYNPTFYGYDTVIYAYRFIAIGDSSWAGTDGCYDTTIFHIHYFTAPIPISLIDSAKIGDTVTIYNVTMILTDTGSTTFSNTQSSSSHNCNDSITNLILTVFPNDTSIHIYNNSYRSFFTTPQTNNSSYNWQHCDGTPIIGSIIDSSTFTATQNGSYECVITTNGINDTTFCFTVAIISTGISEIPSSNISIYPNPSNGSFHVCGITGNYTIQDMSGRAAQIGNLSNSKEIITNITSGVYMISFENTGETKKLVIK